MYRIDPSSGELTLLVDDMEAPNGLCFSPDESLLYVNDTRRRHIRVWEVQPDGTIGNGRIFAELVGNDLGIPDGMKVDAEGNVYCTGPGGMWVMDPSGAPLGRVKVPEQLANFAWGDDDLRTMYFTSRTSVYRMKLKIPGISVWPARVRGRLRPPWIALTAAWTASVWRFSRAMTQGACATTWWPARVPSRRSRLTVVGLRRSSSAASAIVHHVRSALEHASIFR